MTAILLHGVPETFHVWDRVLERLHGHGDEALALPGFLAPYPESFAATKEAHVDWVIGELERRGPVDLERMSQAIGAPLLPLPCGHFTPVKRPDEVARTISDQWRAAGGG